MDYIQKHKGIYNQGMKRIAQGMSGGEFEPYDYKDDIIKGMADGAWWDAWATAWEEADEDGYVEEGGMPWGPGGSINEAAPETPNAAFEFAKKLFDEIQAANPEVKLANFVPPEEDEDTFDAESFGYYLYMEYVGHGVGWSDSHEDHYLKIPYGETPNDLAYEGDPDLREIMDWRNEDFEEEEFQSKQVKLPGVEGKKKALKRRPARKIVAGAYTLELTDEEMESLGYIADRYEYARILYEALEPLEEDVYELHPTGRFEVEEVAAWEFRDAVEQEDGYMPLMGGSLLEKVENLLQQIV